MGVLKNLPQFEKDIIRTVPAAMGGFLELPVNPIKNRLGLGQMRRGWAFFRKDRWHIGFFVRTFAPEAAGVNAFIEIESQ
ncbi:MAG: hypothetical protein ACON5N_17855 [Akkermansiaceae bacterium]